MTPETRARGFAPEPLPGVSFHAQERAVKRVGRALTRAEWLGVVEAIVDRRGAMLSRARDGMEMWLVGVGPIMVKVRWCPWTATVVTLLPDNAHSLTRRGWQE